MITNNSTHPYDLLEAFALDALEAEEEMAVLEHVEGCLECAAIVDGCLRAVTALAYTVPAHRPPERVRAGLLASIELSEPAPQRVSVSQRRPSRGWAGVYSALSSRWGRLLMPVTTLAAVVLFAFAISFNVQMSGEIDNVKAENVRLREEMARNQAAATARLAQASDTVTQMQGSLRLLQNTLAQSGNRSLVMNPAQSNSQSKGVLVLSGDGTACVIMASGLEPLEGDSAYHVWLMQDAERTLAGHLDVDEHGWGTIELNTGGSLSQFDSVQLTRSPPALAAIGVAGDIVLETALP